MPFARDLSLIEDIVLRDTAMADVSADLIARHFTRLRDATQKEEFLLEAMALFALAANGHTRVIPNAAIQTLPVRLIWAGDALWMMGDGPKEVRYINDMGANEAFDALRHLLAGTAQRKKVIGGLCMAWPEVLHGVGAAKADSPVAYGFHDGSEIVFTETDCVPAQSLYPMYETGTPDPSLDPFESSSDPRVLRLASFSTDDTKALNARLDGAMAQIASTTPPSVIDLRGNPGGDFIRHLPILDALKDCGCERIAVLVDRYTFSAAIVFAALCKNRLNATLVGEEMGDAASFHAEGGTLTLPDTGAHLRWSDGFHDWGTGHPTSATPPEIATLMTGCGSLAPKVLAVTTPADLFQGADPALETAHSYLETP